MANRVLIWFRRDLRLADHGAINAALSGGAEVLPVFVLDPILSASDRVGAQRARFLFDGLAALDADLAAAGSGLLVRRGAPEHILPQLAREYSVRAVYAHRDHSPYAQARDRRVAQALPYPLLLFDGVGLRAPTDVLKADGHPFQRFAAYCNAWRALPDPPLPSPFERVGRLMARDTAWRQPLSASHPASPEAMPPVGELGAARRLDRFLSGPVYEYSTRRDELADTSPPVTAQISAHLHFGMISPRQVYWAARRAGDSAPDESARASVQRWIDELIWRDFFVHVLDHFPQVAAASFREPGAGIQWRDAPDEFAAWAAGETGYPVVDAAMRQLAATGWLPNRARMIAASFLVKHLLIDWKQGEQHFMRLLVDGDLTANNGNWQWVAGTGVDAQPFFRIFNPIAQGKRYDPTGDYIRRWVPELRAVPARAIHEPWSLVVPPRGYPAPLIAHDRARARALAAYHAAVQAR